jgi:transposase
MVRFVLTDAQWRKMEPHCLGKPTDPGRSGGDGRLFLETVLWIARTGSPWRDGQTPAGGIEPQRTAVEADGLANTI